MTEANRTQVYKEIEDYVNNVVAPYACRVSNVESVRCARHADNIFMEFVHEDGDVRYFDITSLGISNIGIMVACIMSNSTVSREVRDRERRKKIRKLFK